MKQNMRKNLIYALSAFAVLMLPGCGSKNKTTETEQTKILVKTAAVEEKTIQQNVEFTSNIEPYKQNYVTPAVSGLRIDQILVDVGDQCPQRSASGENGPYHLFAAAGYFAEYGEQSCPQQEGVRNGRYLIV